MPTRGEVWGYFQIIEAGIRIRDTAKQRHLFLPDAVKIQFIGTGQIGDLF